MKNEPTRSLRLAAISSALLALLSCAGGTTNLAAEGRQRAVRVGPPVTQPPANPQWNHEWSRGAVFYEIFVRSFQDSNGDGIGDINGLIAKLDYLNDGNPATTTDLGIDGIWLMPVFESPSYHGYDTTDYETIERDYGTNADFQRLLQEAHRRGIKVIVDYVMNHTSNQHPWFVDSASSASAAKRDWYVWSPSDPGWTQPWGGNYGTWHQLNGMYYYGVFWGGMPDLNYRTPAVRNEMLRFAKFWLDQGVDGFRLDATRYLIETGAGSGGQADTPETHQMLKDLSTTVRQTHPEAVLVAENWTETPIIATYFGAVDKVAGGDEMPMNFNFPLSGAIVEAARTSNSRGIIDVLSTMSRTYPAGIIDAPFLTNHDQVRLATTLGNNTGRLRSAAAVLLTMPGAPFLYYGEEVGLQNGAGSGDEAKRTPMPWTAGGGFTTGNPWYGYSTGRDTQNVASQTSDANSLLSYYRRWISARHMSDALQKGTIAPVDSDSRVFAFTRKSGNETVLVVHNLSDSFVTAGPLNVATAGLDRVYADTGVGEPGGVSGSWTVAMPPRTSGVWRLR